MKKHLLGNGIWIIGGSHMEKKIFFIDFDGTLMRDDKTISDKNREALRAVFLLYYMYLHFYWNLYGYFLDPTTSDGSPACR